MKPESVDTAGRSDSSSRPAPPGADVLFRLLVENAQDYCIFTSDREGRILTWNVGAERLVGYSADEIVGRPCDVIFLEKDREAGAPELERALALRAGRAENERWHLRKDGTRFWGAGIMLALRDEAGTHVGFAKIMRDFTRRREIAASTLRQQRLESVGVLAGGVAHQFNNLLTGVIGNIELLARRPGFRGDDEAAAMAEAALHACRRAAELTRQLVIYAGKARTRVHPLDLGEELADVVARIREQAPARVAVTLDVPPDLPPVEGDPAMVRQMVTHLLLNATEALGARRGTVNVRVRPMGVSAEVARRDYAAFDLRPGPYVCLEVHDTGPGMDAQTLARAFEPFFSTKFQGRGLGLAEVLGVVRAHGGAVSAESTPDAGTTFRVLHPVAASHAGAATTAERPTILVCDDEELIRSLVGTILEEEGFTILQAENGAQAVRVVERMGDEIALVLLDVAMPVMDGTEAAPLIRQARPGLPIVLMTGLGELDVGTRSHGAHGLGSNEVLLTKPFTLDRVVEAVREALPGRQAAPRGAD